MGQAEERIKDYMNNLDQHYTEHYQYENLQNDESNLLDAQVMLQALVDGAKAKNIKLIHHAGYGFIGEDIETAKIFNKELRKYYEADEYNTNKWLDENIGYKYVVTIDEHNLWNKCLSI